MYDTAGGTASYGPETQIDKTGSGQRLLVYQGTVNINKGAYVKVGGDSGGWCNFIGIDKPNPAAMNINGGTVWCSTSGGGAGVLGVGNKNNGITSTLTLNSGLLRVDTQLRSSTYFNSLAGCTSSGTITINGGEAEVKQVVFGASSSSTGTSTLTLNGGVLTVQELNFQPYNGQVFTWKLGTVVAARADIFKIAEYKGSKSRTMQITGTPAVFDTAGFHQTIPAFTAGSGGRLWIKGGGTVAFENPALPYYLHLGDVTVDLGTLDAASPALTTPGLEIVGPVTLNVSLPESPSGRYALISCDYAPAGSPAQITVAGGGAGKVVLGGADAKIRFDTTSADGKSIELGLAANVAAFAWWTGAANDGDFANPVNWACTNSTGGVVANALPVKSTVVVLSGATTFTVPAGTTPIWATTQIGDGNGAVALGADCDWTAAPNVTIADGSYIDLNGHNLKVSYLTAEADAENAYVTNSVAGTKPALWTENAFAESEYIDTEKVTVYTDALEVKSVNNKTFTAPTANFASAMDASCIVTGGVMNVGGMVYLGSNNHDALFCVSNSATAQFYQFRVGNYDTGHNRVVVADNATFKITGSSANHITVGHHNSVESVFTQDGGTVTVASDCNIGVGNSATSRYEMVSGTLTVGNAFVIGRNETTAGVGAFVQSDGTVKANKYLSIGYQTGSEGLYLMSGGTFTITANRANLGSEGAVKMGLWDISGGTATTAKGLNVALSTGSTATLRLRESGTLVTADITGQSGASTVEFDGGTLVATNVAANGVFLNGITNVVFGANAVAIDTAGYGLGIANCVLKATPGARAITLAGGGTLDFTGTTLDFTEPLAGGFTLAKVADGDAATFTGVPALAEGVKGCLIKLSADGKEIKVLSNGFMLIVR